MRALIAASGGSNTNSISLANIKQGSAIVTGNVDPTATSGTSSSSSQFNGMLTALASGFTIGGMQITGSSMTVVGGFVPASATTDSLGLILGICIPIGILSNFYLI